MTKKGRKPKHGPTTERILPVQLTEEEIREAGAALATAVREIRDTDRERKETNSEYNAIIKGVGEEANRLATMVHRGTEDRPVECHWLYDWDRSEKDLIRTDTGEGIMQAEIGPEERQQIFEGIEPEPKEDPHDDSTQHPGDDTPAPLRVIDGKSAAAGEREETDDGLVTICDKHMFSGSPEDKCPLCTATGESQND